MASSIIIAEDEQSVRDVIEDILGDFSTTVTPNGQEAYDEFIRCRAELIITDLVMPEMDGVEFIKKVREIDHSIPIIVITGYSHRQVESIKAGATYFFHKPIEYNTLVSQIEFLLSNRDIPPVVD